MSYKPISIETMKTLHDGSPESLWMVQNFFNKYNHQAYADYCVEKGLVGKELYDFFKNRAKNSMMVFKNMIEKEIQHR